LTPTACTGGPFKRASDPWVSFSPNGTAYYFTLAFDPDLPNGAFGRNALLVSRSTNGGQTWAFVSWSDGGAQSHVISTPAVATTYKARYKKQ